MRRGSFIRIICTFELVYLVADKGGGFKVELFDRVRHLLTLLFNKHCRIFFVELCVEREHVFDRPLMLSSHRLRDVMNLFFNCCGRDAVLLVMRHLDSPAASCLSYRAL